jgi:hypothetical protein
VQREQLVAPPQSTALSPPFFTASLQLAAWHLPPLHTALEQSLAAVQERFAAQRTHAVAPPQSTSVSPPFLTASLQVAV